MASNLDRERERKRERKELRKGAEQYRKQFGRDPSEQEMEALRILRRKGAGASMLLPRSGHRELVQVGSLTEDGIKGPIVDQPDFARQAEYLFHSAKFLGAKTHAEQLTHLQGAIIGLMKAAGIQDPFLQGAPILAALADMDDQRAGREGRILQALADPVLPAPQSNAQDHALRWIASAFVVGLGLSVEKFDSTTKKPALLKVIAELEGKEHLAGNLDGYFTDGVPTTDGDDESARTARHHRLVKRFGEVHRGKLTNGDVPVSAKLAFDMLKKSVDESPATKLKAEFPIWLMKAANMIRSAKERPDTKRKPKGGSRRVTAQEKKLDFSTAD